MTLRNELSIAAKQTKQLRSSLALETRKVTKSSLRVMLAVLALATISWAGGPPDAPSTVALAEGGMIEPVTPVRVSQPAVFAPETKTVDLKFVTLGLISTGSTLADSYTTLFARENWLAGKRGACTIEVESAYLYGTHPTVGRAYAVASMKSLGSVAAAYYLKKHHNKFWSLPLVANSVISLQGVTQNMAACN